MKSLLKAGLKCPRDAWLHPLVAREVPLPGSGRTVIYIGYDDALLHATAIPGQEADSSASAVPLTSRTFDLLLDVELPVSISFGRAQVQLKDVLKLTTGSIVELNRAISEPVESWSTTASSLAAK